MDMRLSDGRLIFINKDEPVMNEKAAGRMWLEQYQERKTAMNVEGMSPDQLYDELDRLDNKKRQLGRARDEYTTHTRQYYDGRRKEVKAELRRRELPIRRPGSEKIYPTTAHLATKRMEAKT